jgi:hypothetical protein
MFKELLYGMLRYIFTGLVYDYFHLGPPVFVELQGFMNKGNTHETRVVASCSEYYISAM